METDSRLEKLIDILENNLREEGYLTKRYSQTNGKLMTTSYDVIMLRDEDGDEYTLNINENLIRNRKTGNIECANNLTDEAMNPMRFFEFGENFGYYALIGAQSEEEAVAYYSETIADIEDKGATPIELTKEVARKKLFNICKDSNEQNNARKEFNKETLGISPYLILLDGSLL